MKEEQSDLAQMVRLALAEQTEDVRLFAARLVRKYRGTAPDLAEQLELFLKSKPARSVSPMRKLSPQPSATHALPVDDESRLSLLKVFKDAPTKDAPLLSSDVEQSIRFYQDLLEFPLTELIENRDYAGSSHFFFDIGNGNLLAFFDFPGLDVGPYQEVLGGLHHIAISVAPEKWNRLRDKLSAAGVDLVEHSEVSLYFRDPDGARIELIADPLGEMYGSKVL